jgi:thiamine biosynthesis lipoprotein ApbE
MSIYIHQSHLRINLLLCLSLASCRAEPRPTVSRVWPELGAMMSAAAWSGDTAPVARALAAAHDSVDRIDSLLQRPVRIAALDSTARDIRRRTGVAIVADSFAAGYALDRAARVLAPVVDSALLTLGPQYLWVGPPTQRFVGIADPKSSLKRIAVIDLQTGSISTSARRPRSVTVLAADGLTASAWSAALVALNCDSVMMLGRREALSVFCADSTNARFTADLQNRVSLRAAPAP